MTHRTPIHQCKQLKPLPLILPNGDAMFRDKYQARSISMLNFLRHASDRGRKELVLKIEDFEYHVILLLVATGNVILKSRTPDYISILVEKP